MFIKYREIGLALIPLRPNSKAPLLDGWTQYCDRLPTEEECALWENLYPNHGKGLVCGPASGVLIEDIDSDEARILNACKPSPVRKRGRKGESRIFRYNGDIPSCKVAGCIDILSYGRQTVLPPSIHPETNQPYIWLTPDTLENFSVSDLPEFTLDDLSDLRRILEPEKFEIGDVSRISLQGPFFNTDPKRGSPTGSQDRLKRIISAIIARGASPDEAVRELLRYDDENHRPIGYFSDRTRADCQADPFTNAIYFYASNLRTFNRREVRAGRSPSIPFVSGSELLDISQLSKPKPSVDDRWVQKKLPEPRGFIKEVRDLICSFSKYDQPGLAMGGALALCSVLIANRFKFEDTWPNIYVLGISPTGSGKQFPIDTISKLLLEHQDTGLFGKGQVLSGQALIKGLNYQRERLDVIDECHSLFSMITRGGTFQSDVLPLLLRLYSGSSGFFMGPETKNEEPLRLFHPCVSTIMLTNMDSFRLSMTRDFVSGGFLPRCLTFIDEVHGDRNESFGWDTVRGDKISARIEEILKIKIEMDIKNLVHPKPVPKEIFCTPEAKDLFEAFDVEIDREKKVDSISEVRRHILSRPVQNAKKLALIHGFHHEQKITQWDATWAIESIKALMYNCEPLYEKLMSSTPAEAATLGVIDIVRRHGRISEAKFFEATRALTKNQRAEAVDAARVEGKIRVCTDNIGRVYEII